MRFPISEMQRHTLRQQGCTFAPDCSVEISHNTALEAIRNVHFAGHISLGSLDPLQDQVICNAFLRDCTIGEQCHIRNAMSGICGAKIGNNVRIENVGCIVFEPEARCGMGVEAAVLDETGSRIVPLYPGLTAQIASLIAHRPRWNETEYSHMLNEWVLSGPEVLKRVQGHIGDNAIIKNTLSMLNVGVDHDVHIFGALKLTDGMLVNNLPPGEKAFAHIGYGVNAEGFIIEDGRVDNGVLLRRCYVGQGAVLDKGFTAHDSLFFANCGMECGEACAIFAGPYSVSMHKSSLLIGAQLSFMNAGSGTNFSNHMYKLGPIHWGIMQRGVKTSSSAYVMWGARIGSFSLVMGQHKHHPDTSQFPFSYLFATGSGHTSVLPGVMLKSCGLARDYAKWPARDKRRELGMPLHDNIIYEVLNPCTVSAMIDAFSLFCEIESSPLHEDGCHHYQGLRFRPGAIPKARHYYRLGILKYLSMHPADPNLAPMSEGVDNWVDLAGQIMPAALCAGLTESESKAELEQFLNDTFTNYDAMEQGWIRANLDRITETLNLSADPAERTAQIEEGAREFEKMVDCDKSDYLATLRNY